MKSNRINSSHRRVMPICWCWELQTKRTFISPPQFLQFPQSLVLQTKSLGTHLQLMGQVFLVKLHYLCYLWERNLQSLKMRMHITVTSKNTLSLLTMHCFRKYLYLSMEGFLGLTTPPTPRLPPPLENLLYSGIIILFQKFGSFFV